MAARWSLSTSSGPDDTAAASPRAHAAEPTASDLRYVAWFHELDAWTEYWDVYHPETKGRFYFGDGQGETGLLGRFLPRTEYPPPWKAWHRAALNSGSHEDFCVAVREPEVAAALLEVDDLVSGLFARHFGDAADPVVQADYLVATFRFALDVLPPATEREARLAPDDWRKRTAGRHTLDGDLMWFAWALHTEAVEAIAGERRAPRRPRPSRADAGRDRRGLPGELCLARASPHPDRVQG